ncbi:MAG TPA: GNAT family N-acetyltransferase [Candidatus Saccharimonadales bacterium]|nr:GNAT family N-acetyltransferase [Candidatus Saccharimonadales bacterium]
MKIIKATVKHLSEINKLNKTYFKEIRDFAKIIAGQNDYFYVALENEKVIGFSGFHYYSWNNTAAIIDIFVHPKLRGQGHGSQLIKKIISQVRLTKARTIIAEAPSLSGVLILYLKNDFRICGFNDRYYDNRGQEIAIFLAKDLK